MKSTYLKKSGLAVLLGVFFLLGCKKDNNTENITKEASLSFTVDGVYNGTVVYTGASVLPVIKFLSPGQKL